MNKEFKKQNYQGNKNQQTNSGNTSSNIFTGDIPPDSDVLTNNLEQTVVENIVLDTPPETVVNNESENTKMENPTPNLNVIPGANQPSPEPEVTPTPPAPTVDTTSNFKPVTKVEMSLVSYLEAMDKSKAINPEEGGKRQYGLWLVIQDIINSKTHQQFKDEWNTLLNFANKHKDNIFNENFIYRFPQHWTGSNNEFTNFRRLIHIVISTCNPATRNKALETISIEKALELLSETQKNNVVNFYS